MDNELEIGKEATKNQLDQRVQLTVKRQPRNGREYLLFYTCKGLISGIYIELLQLSNKKVK